MGSKIAEEGGGERGESEKGTMRVIGVKEGGILQEDPAEPLQEA
jgi:hypothetical protein